MKEKACAEIEAQSFTDSSDYETDEEWEEHRKKQQAIVYKDQVGKTSWFGNIHPWRPHFNIKAIFPGIGIPIIRIWQSANFCIFKF